MAFKRILLPTDFSGCALNAARYAVKMALELDSHIVFVTGYHLPYSTTEFGAAVDQSMIKLFEDESEENFNRLRQELTELDQITCEYVPVVSQAKEAIVKTIDRYKPDMVIMGTHGKSGVGHKLFGSITNAVIGSIGVPLMAIPLKVKYRNPLKVALGCDFRFIKDLNMLESLQSLVKQFKSELHLVHVSEHVGDIELDEEFEAQKLKDFFNEIDPNIHELAYNSTEQGLLSFAEKNKIDMLALIPRKHSLLQQLVNHSVTKRMVLESGIPLLVLPG